MELSVVEYIGLLAIGGAFFWIIFQLDKLNIKEVKVEWVSPKVKKLRKKKNKARLKKY